MYGKGDGDGGEVMVEGCRGGVYMGKVMVMVER